MIETKILGDAVGVQRGDVIDNSETTVLPSLANGVVVGKFKRGRTDKPFKVTSSNYRSLLGHDPSNPSYLAVEDAFKRGISEISILRVGDTGSDTKETIEVHGCAVIDFNPPIIIPNACTPTALDILYTTGEGVQPTGDLYGRYRVNGGAWVNYTAPADYYLVRDFLEHTVVIRQLGGGSDSAFAFEAKRWGGYINGASAQAPYANMQNGILSIEQTTVDFQITDGGANDLVQLLFGGNASVSSCAIGRWMGV